jgi:hypothetical protein
MTDGGAGSLATIESALRRLGREVLLRSLQPGLPADAVRTALAAEGLRSRPELEALWGWRDGVPDDTSLVLDDIQLFPGFYLASLDEAVTNSRKFGADERWTAGWLPVFANGGGDFYVVSLAPADAGAVRHFRVDETEHPVEFASLTAMTATLAAAFERGVFFVDDDGYLEMDDDTFAELAAELNPDVPWWTDEG